MGSLSLNIDLELESSARAEIQLGPNDLSLIIPVALEGNASFPDPALRLEIPVALESNAEATVQDPALRLEIPVTLESNGELSIESPPLAADIPIALESNGTASIARFYNQAAEIDLALEGNATASTGPVALRRQMVGWAMTMRGLDGQSINLWSGRGQLNIRYRVGESIEYEGVTKDGGALMSVSPVESGLGDPNKRLTIRLAVVGEAIRRLLQKDYGPVPIRVDWIYSNDSGESWQPLRRSFTGRLSNPLYKDGVYTVEAETYLGDADKGEPRKWSHAARLAYNGDDIFRNIARYAEGSLETRWPP